MQKKVKNEDGQEKNSNKLTIWVVALAGLVLALASGNEVGYGNFLVVYAKFNLDFTEASA
jgi:hypothetical protein